MIDLLTSSAIAFFVIMAILVYTDRKNIEFKNILLLRRTKRGIRLINSIAKSAPKFWNFVGLLAIPTAILFMVAGAVLMAVVSGTVLSGEQKTPAVAVMLPSLSSEQQIGFGGLVFFLPLWFWLILITILLVPHEVFHGILARTVKVPLKSVGLLLLLIFPGAFVEPNEKILARAKKLDRLKVYSAGAFANILTAVVLFAMLNFIFQPLVIAGVGMKVYNTTEDSPARFAGIAPNMTILGINGIALDKNSRNPIGDALSGSKPGDNITITTENATFALSLARSSQNFSKPFIGVTTAGPVITKTNYLGISSVSAVFSYVSMLIYFALAIALVNLLPWKPFDGGLIFETLFEYVSPKHAKSAANIATVVIFALFLFSIFGPTLLKLI
ncbi:MAG: site-2 protease family protein [Candidatus Aenigmatarchaeota archaeon]